MAVYKRDIVDINLETGNIHRSFLKHSIGYKDQQADHFGIRAYRNGEPVNLTGVSIQGIFMPPQGSPIAITSGNIVNYNEAEVVLPQACYNYDGQFTLAIKLVDPSNSVTGTMRIVDGMVDNTHASGTVAPVAAIPSYQEVLSTYEQAIAAINKTVRFDAVQSLTDTQKATARGNISAPSVADLQAEAEAREAADTALGGRVDDEETVRANADTAINNAIGTVPSGKTVQGQIDTLESGKVPKTTTVNGHALSANVTVTKADVGLGNVDNTSDANKPISTAQAAVNTQVSNIIGNTSLPTTAQTLTGAIAEHEGDLTSQQGQITDLKSALDSIAGNVEFTQGGKINTSGSTVDVTAIVSDPACMYAIVDCQQNDIFTIKGTGLKNYRLWCFINQSNQVLTVSGQNVTADNVELIAPANSSKLVLNITGEGYCIKGKSIAAIVSDTQIYRGNLYALGYTSLATCKENGWYSLQASAVSTITDLPTDYDGKGFVLEVFYKALGTTSIAILQRITSTDGNVWTRFINDSGVVLYAWKKHTHDIPDFFTFAGYIEDLEYTKVAQCLSEGWYGCRRAYVSSITDLPVGYDNQGFTLEVFVHTLGSSSVSIMQRITSTDGGVWVRIINTDGSSVLYDWKKVSASASGNEYWQGKKVSWFGDSLSYGNGVSSGSAFPYLVANKLGMTIKNYAIGGSVVAKQAGTYDEIVFSLTEFNSMTKDTTKKYLVLDDPTDSHPYRIYTYTNGEWTPTSSHTAAINGRYPIVDVVTGMDASYSDVIVIAVAYNDFMYHWTPFGDMSSRDKTTFYGALHTLCQYLQTTYTESDIVFVSVENSRCQVSGQSGADWSFTEPDQTNPLGKTLRDYFNAMEEVCRYYSIPVLNLGENLGFAQYTIPATYVQNDGCHWTVDGHKRAASVLIQMFDALRANVT